MTGQRSIGTTDVLKNEHDDLLHKKGMKKDAQNLLYNEALKNYLHRIKEISERPIPVTFKQHKINEPIYETLPPATKSQSSVYTPTSRTQSSVSNYSVPDVSIQEDFSTPKLSSRYPKRARLNKTIEKNKKSKKALLLGDYLMKKSEVNEDAQILNTQGKAIAKSNVYKSAKKLMHNSPSLPSPPGHALVKKLIKNDPEAQKYFQSPRIWSSSK
uniref:Uncharacterized protein n=1 Tax=Panagrolaimus sp. ES5 TaxID=591445 RepID=A0AC34GXR0_9BILA